ncbi:MAG: hypothetical protein JO186_12590 [Actinobacteria bacterium]|nr:hypothetical protein [Actinomycetota bacterium]MBV8396495.1 hypothetical protein [Actinomycetota bacterium]
MTSRYAPLWTLLTMASAALAILSLFLWPFLFAPIAALLLLTAARNVEDRRWTAPTIWLVTLCAMLGATFAIVFKHALY